MKKMIIVSIVFLLLFTSAQVMGVSKDMNDINDNSQSLEKFYDLFGNSISIIIDEYGQPKFVDDLYGGKIYYYDNLPVSFGVDNGLITSIYVYYGEINNEIYIGIDQDTLLEKLNLSEVHCIESDAFGNCFLIEIKGICYYMIFYNEVLEEVIIKNNI